MTSATIPSQAPTYPPTSETSDKWVIISAADTLAGIRFTSRVNPGSSSVKR